MPPEALPSLTCKWRKTPRSARNIGEPISPSDPGDSTYQTYELLDGTAGSGDSAYFRIHRDDGQIYVNERVGLRGSANAMPRWHHR